MNRCKLKTSKYFVFLCMMILIIVQGCEKDPDTIEPEQPDPIELHNQVINEWILDNMEVFYYWNDWHNWNPQIPQNINTKLKPEVYFESLLHQDDHFSVIYDNYQTLRQSLSGVSTEAGYDYVPLLISERNIMCYISYIKPGTPAQTAGLKRGDLFLRINNNQLTIDNYRLLHSETGKMHTLGMAKIEGNDISFIENVALTVIEGYEENPILLDTLYNIQNRKIGYFVYNFFARDSKEGGIEYEKELNNLFGKYKTEGIDDLIIDLRYNSGGTVITAQALASMIANRSKDDIFGVEDFNFLLHSYFSATEGEDYNKMYFLDEIVRTQNDKVTINKLGLSRVYLIVSRHTASASELIINGLRPYLGNENVVLVGDKTYGKNYGSMLIYERDPIKQQTNDWALLPVVFKLSNKDGFSDYGSGFEPDIAVREDVASALPFMKQLGDTEELLLATTLDLIFGISKSVSKSAALAEFEFFDSTVEKLSARNNMYIYDRKINLP